MDHSVRKLTPYRVISIALLIILALMMLFPLYWIVTGSVKDARTINSRTPVLFPANPTLDNYAKLFSRPAWTWMFNTVFICGVAMLLTCLCGAMGGYALAKKKFTGRNFIFGLFVCAMALPKQVIMIPLYLEEFNLKILNTYLGLILPRTASAYGIYMLTSFFSGVPKSLDEAARIDGMKEFQIYSRIIAPLAKPAFVTLGIYHFMNNWNDLLYPMMLTSSVDMRTLSAGLAILVGSNSIKFGPTLAATVISVAPLLVLFLFGQKFFMEGIATSGMKE